MAHPFPNLQIHPTSGLLFPWAEHHPGGAVGSFDATMGPDGVLFTMHMLINWNDLAIALQTILGFSYRDDTGIYPQIRRVLPWQHPLANQLWVKDISSIKGITQQGNAFIVFGGGGAGLGFVANTGPWTTFALAELIIHFWRPPYYIRTDADITDPILPIQLEWLRFLDKNWEINVSMLAREASTFNFVTEGGVGGNVPNIVGQKLCHLKLKRRWYQIPEQCLFQPLTDRTPQGLPRHLLYTQTDCTNPITDYVLPHGSPIGGCVNGPIGGVPLKFVACGITLGSADITNLNGGGNPGTGGLANGFYCDAPQFPPGSKIIDIPDIDTVTLDHVALDNATDTVIFEDPDLMFLGFPMGTLLLEGIELIPRPLQLPPFLMGIPFFNGNEPIAQQQYDVVFHFDFFDPPRGPASYAFRGHNLMPQGATTLWRAVQSQGQPDGAHYTTPFQYADFSDLFSVL